MNFTFNGTSTFDKVWDTVNSLVQENPWVVSTISKRNDFKFENNKLIVNVAGFSKEEINVDIDTDDKIIEIECKGQSEFYGDTLNFSLGIPEEFNIFAPEQVTMTYSNGLLIFEFKQAEKPSNKTRLSFS